MNEGCKDRETEMTPSMNQLTKDYYKDLLDKEKKDK